MREFISFLYHMLPLICGIVFLTLGCVLGGMDAGNTGLGVGALLGLLSGVVVGFIATNILVLLFGRIATDDPTSSGVAARETLSRRGRRFAFRLLAIAALVTVVHESYWFGNMWMATVNHNAEAYMTRAASHDYSPKRLKEDLRAQRWRHDVLSARPLKWLFDADAEMVNQANREIIEVITRDRIEKADSRLKDIPTTRKLAIFWGSSDWFVNDVEERSLSIYGTAVCSWTAGKLEKHQSKGFVLRYLPKAWFR